MPDIILNIVSGGTDVELGLEIPGVQGPIGASTLPAGGTVGQIIVKASATNYDASWTSSASGLTLRNSTISGATLAGTLSGGSFTSPTVVSGTINFPVISGGAAVGTALSSAIVDDVDITNSTIGSTVIFASTISGSMNNVSTMGGGTYNNPTINGPTLSGIVAFAGGVTIGGSASQMSFYGNSPVSRTTGIVTPSGGASTAELAATLSGVVTALKNLGLIA